MNNPKRIAAILLICLILSPALYFTGYIAWHLWPGLLVLGLIVGAVWWLGYQMENKH